jgi:hypothetical protein
MRHAEMSTHQCSVPRKQSQEPPPPFLHSLQEQKKMRSCLNYEQLLSYETKVQILQPGTSSILDPMHYGSPRPVAE